MSADLELDQEDFAARLAADSYFADIKVLLQRKGVTDSDIEVALSVLNEEGGKIGACVIVLMPELVAEDPAVPTPLYRVRVPVQVIEQPLMSGDATSGVGKSAEQIAERVRQVLHHFSTGRGGSSHLFHFDGQQPLDVDPAKVSYLGNFGRKAGDDLLTRVAAVVLASAAGDPTGFDITLTCPTDGAAIYYSTDGDYPDTLYSAAFNVAAGTTIRATARKTGLQESNPKELTV
jgi:hypothetical protein